MVDYVRNETSSRGRAKAKLRGGEFMTLSPMVSNRFHPSSTGVQRTSSTLRHPRGSIMPGAGRQVSSAVDYYEQLSPTEMEEEEEEDDEDLRLRGATVARKRYFKAQQQQPYPLPLQRHHRLTQQAHSFEHYEPVRLLPSVGGMKQGAINGSYPLLVKRTAGGGVGGVRRLPEVPGMGSTGLGGIGRKLPSIGGGDPMSGVGGIRRLPEIPAYRGGQSAGKILPPPYSGNLLFVCFVHLSAQYLVIH